MLLAAVAHQARLNVPADPKQPDGPTVRDHLTAAVRMGRMKPDALDGPEIPDAHAYLLGWYGELARGRTYGMHGANPITYEGIAAWSRLMGRTPSGEEVDALFAIDRVSLNPPPEERD